MKLVGVAAFSLVSIAVGPSVTRWQEIGTPTQSERVAVPSEPAAWGTALTAIEQASASVREWRTQTSPISEGERAAYRRLAAASVNLRRELAELEARIAPPPAQAPNPDRTAYVLSKPWIDAIRALGAEAPAKREAALGEVRAALQGSDPQRQQAGLITLKSVGDIEYDKASFRPLVLPYTASATGATLVNSFYALFNTMHEEADLTRLHEAWVRDRAGLKTSVLHLLALYAGGRVEGRSEDIALDVLSEKYDRSTTGLNGLWGARVGPRLEARVLELSNSPDHNVAYDAFYYALSTFENKSEPVVDKVLALLTSPDPNYSQRALWGIGMGVPEALQPKVANALVDLHNSRSDARVRESCAHLVRQYGDAQTQSRLQR